MMKTAWPLFVSAAALVHLILSQLLAENVAMRRIDPTIVVLDHLSLVETEFLHVKFLLLLRVMKKKTLLTAHQEF